MACKGMIDVTSPTSCKLKQRWPELEMLEMMAAFAAARNRRDCRNTHADRAARRMQCGQAHSRVVARMEGHARWKCRGRGMHSKGRQRTAAAALAVCAAGGEAKALTRWSMTPHTALRAARSTRNLQSRMTTLRGLHATHNNCRFEEV